MRKSYDHLPVPAKQPLNFFNIIYQFIFDLTLFGNTFVPLQYLAIAVIAFINIGQLILAMQAQAKEKKTMELQE